MLKNRIVARFLAILAKACTKIILSTCRFRVEGFDRFNQAAKNGTSIIIVWHNRLSLVPEILTRFAKGHSYTAVISNSKDAESLAVLAESYQAKVIRVAHDARYQALRQITQELKKDKEVIIITPDGPRGPRYQIKPGVIIAAKTTKSIIYPLSWSCSRFWQLKTWDKMIIPKPFSTICANIAEGVSIDGDEYSENKKAASLLEEALKQSVKKSCEGISPDPASWPS